MGKKILIFEGAGTISFSNANKMNDEDCSPVIIPRNK